MFAGRLTDSGQKESTLRDLEVWATKEGNLLNQEITLVLTKLSHSKEALQVVVQHADLKNILCQLVPSFDRLDRGKLGILIKMIELEFIPKKEMLEIMKETEVVQVLLQGFTHPDVHTRQKVVNCFVSMANFLGIGFEPYLELLKSREKKLVEYYRQNLKKGVV